MKWRIPLFLLLFGLACVGMAQNVGIGLSTPLDRLHVAGFIRSDTLASADTNVVVSDVNGRLINLAPGGSGQVLTSQGAGRSPQWTNPSSGSPGRFFFGQLGSTITNSVTTGSAGITNLVSLNFTPVNDTVMVTVSVAGRISVASGMPATPLQKWGFRLWVNGVLTKMMYPHVNANATGGGTATGDLTGSFTLPIPVTAGASNTLLLDVGGLFTTAGSATLRINPAITTEYATISVADFPTN